MFIERRHCLLVGFSRFLASAVYLLNCISKLRLKKIKVFVYHVGCKGYLRKAMNPYLLIHLNIFTVKRLRIIRMLGVILLLC
jgi:hypothetical protein